MGLRKEQCTIYQVPRTNLKVHATLKTEAIIGKQRRPDKQYIVDDKMFDKVSPPEIKEEVRVDKEPTNTEEQALIEQSNAAAEVVEEAPPEDEQAEEIFEAPEPEKVEEPEPVVEEPPEPVKPSFEIETVASTERPPETEYVKGLLARDFNTDSLNTLQTSACSPYLVQVKKAQE